VHALFLVAVVLSGLAAGATFNTAAAMVPALRSVDPATGSEVRRSASRIPARCVVGLAVGAVLAGVALLAFYGQTQAARALVAVGIGLSALLLACGWVAMQLELSLSTAAEELPGDRHVALRRRWDASQLLMAAVSIGAVACYATGAASVS
jgi:MFS family permease